MMHNFSCFIRLSLALVILTSCTVAGESLVLFEGEIHQKPINSAICNLSIHSGDLELASFTVEKKFSVDYTVEAKSREYRIEVYCLDNTNKTVLKREVLTLGDKAITQIDLGSINGEGVGEERGR